MEQQRDERLWRMAQHRAAFKRNLYSYIIVNLLMWGIWWFTQGSDYLEHRQGIPWPVWVMLGWGVGLAFHYFRAYQGSKTDLAEKEYEKLRQQQNL